MNFSRLAGGSFIVAWLIDNSIVDAGVKGEWIWKQYRWFLGSGRFGASSMMANGTLPLLMYWCRMQNEKV
jgi:hypothetical protein